VAEPARGCRMEKGEWKAEIRIRIKIKIRAERMESGAGQLRIEH
jgi:hypothetical protein